MNLPGGMNVLIPQATLIQDGLDRSFQPIDIRVQHISGLDCHMGTWILSAKHGCMYLDCPLRR